jgi:hypothetical protein
MSYWQGLLIGVIPGIAIGSLVQILLWKNDQTTVIEALFKHPAAWIVYLIVGGVIAERAMRFFKKQS